ncbi:hypothetical protein E2C01_001745 [Portunus trituberculatus]|uniref:Uncharacterized protein n=1 Tax=Portunus trituberculatus TaxID=210409 RepID=A0A5B7CHG4_PORTR|nr:hypothetical protein [Portunus trituberculatus]
MVLVEAKGKAEATRSGVSGVIKVAIKTNSPFHPYPFISPRSAGVGEQEPSTSLLGEDGICAHH